MTTITKEEVKAFIEQIESDLANGWEAQIFELKLARIALASLNATPIYQVQYGQQWRDVSKEVYGDHRDHGSSTRIVYAEPVSQTNKLPHTQFEQVADLYEMQFDDGRTCAFHTDAQKAVQWLQA